MPHSSDGVPHLMTGSGATDYEQETYGELQPFVKREWLLTNGLGGYAGGTVCNVNTRRYHATLVAATLPPVGRVVTVSRWSEILMVGDERFDLSAAYFREELVGEGPRHLRRFKLADETAMWEFDVEGTKVFRELFVCWGSNAASVRYHLVPGPAHRDKVVTLHASPFFAMRDFHSLRHTGEAELQSEADRHGARVRHRDLSAAVWMESHGDAADAGARYDADPDWWYAHTYPMEAARGLDDREDLFCPGTFSLSAGEMGSDVRDRDLRLWCCLGDRSHRDIEEEKRNRIEGMRLRELPTPVQQKLVRAAADFVVRRRRPDGMPGTTIIAGYPWFSDWGRDVFIALPGLLLSTGRHGAAGQVLSTFAAYVSEGMIPNRFDDYTNEPSYNTVDASLWFIHAAHEYLRVTKDRDTYDSLLRPACEAIIDGYTAGTRFLIGVDPTDGLVTAGDAESQLTWMDAKYEGEVFTPRHGKPVEINALWYNALCHLRLDDRAAQVRDSFNKAYLLGGGRGLADVVRGAAGEYERDDSLRPNQIFAVSLPHSPLDEATQHETVDIVRRELLTPYGLRTLSRDSEKYEKRYTGPMHDRDRAYHNGSVWPWLIGPFLEAHLRINGRSAASLARGRTWLQPVLDHLTGDGCLGSISEVFDAEFPYRPGGCVAQAWSVAEVLRLAVELDA